MLHPGDLNVQLHCCGHVKCQSFAVLSIGLKKTQTLLNRITDCRVSCFSVHVVYHFKGDDSAVHCSSPDSPHVEMEGGPRQLGHSAVDFSWRLAGLQSACTGFLLS